LVVDTDRVLAPAIAGKGFQPVCRWDTQVIQIAGLMKHIELSPGGFFDATELPGKTTHPKGLGRAITKRPDHGETFYTVNRDTSNV
jgi:hypothetical protein